MLFAILNIDKPESLDQRIADREEHRAYLRDAGPALKLAGPLLGDDEKTPIGSLLIVEADDMEEARDFARNDPYAVNGLFQSSSVAGWQQVFPED